MTTAPRRLVMIRGRPEAEADAHAPCPPPAGEVTLGRVLRIAGLLLALGPVVLAGLALAVWIVWQIASWAYLIAGGGA